MNNPLLTFPVTVEFEDVDSYGIAHHTALVAYLERIRVRLLAQLGVGLPPDGPYPVMYELAIRFRKPARLLERLNVSVALTAADQARLDLRYEIRRGHELIARASSVIAFWDAADDRPAAVPTRLLEAWAHFTPSEN